MKVLITGGAGFIGQHLARHLVASGHEVVALDLMHPQVHQDPGAAIAAFPGAVLLGDVAEESAWDAIEPPNAVVHLAAETGTGQSMYEQDRYHRVNVHGTALAGAYSTLWGVPLVALSSRAVYGNGRHECAVHGIVFGDACCDRSRPAPSTEDDGHCPVSVYGETKSLGEQKLTPAAETVPVTVIRPQNVIGPGQALHNPYTGVLAAFLAMLREGRPITVYGDGTQTRDFVHVDDLARLIAWLLANPTETGTTQVLNSGTGVRTTLLELAQHAIDGRPAPVTGEVPIQHLDVHRAGDIDHACADLSRLQEIGAPTPMWSTADAVADFISFSWDRPGADAGTWTAALDELAKRGLTS